MLPMMSAAEPANWSMVKFCTKKSQKPRPKKETTGKPKLAKIFEVKDTKPPKAERKECKCKGKKTCGGYVKRKKKAKKKG